LSFEIFYSIRELRNWRRDKQTPICFSSCVYHFVRVLIFVFSKQKQKSVKKKVKKTKISLKFPKEGHKGSREGETTGGVQVGSERAGR
jgi:hypothetical protein